MFTGTARLRNASTVGLTEGVRELCLKHSLLTDYTHVYIVAITGEASNSEMLTLWAQVVSAESATSEELQQV